MSLRLLIQFLMVLVFCGPVYAGKQSAAPAATPAAPTAAQQDFTDKYNQAKAAGQDALSQFQNDITNHGSQEQNDMMNNLNQGKMANGATPTAPPGFHGDPTDSGPTDWSNYNIQTDANGNITGFKLKDADQIDTDHDGKISDDELAAWKKKKADEDAKNGGPPGYRPPKPPPGVGANGKPLPGFFLDCYQCSKLPYGAVKITEENHYHGGNEKPKDSCENHGFSSDGTCGGKCGDGECVPVDVDKSTNNIVPSNATRDSNMNLMTCFACKNKPHYVTVEITYVVIIIETPYVRYVLNRTGETDAFTPSSVMALAKVDPETGKIPNVTGNLQAITDFVGGFNVGFGQGGVTTTGQVSMDNLSGLLKSGLSSGGHYGSNCFDNVQKQADQQASSAGTPTSQNILDGKQNNQDRGTSEKSFSDDQMKKSDNAGAPAVSGPVVACGTQDGNKVLKVYASGGQLVDTITQAMLKADPNIILEKLGVAQSFTDKLMLHTNFDLAGMVEKFTGLPLKEMQSVAATIESVKSPIDQALLSKKQNNSNGHGSIIPNDPLYPLPKAAKKDTSFFFGIIGGGLNNNIPVNNANADSQTADMVDNGDGVKEQYYLPAIGYTPLNDPGSAWNVVDATQKNVVVALVDSGLDLSHPDGPQYIWTNPVPNDEGFVGDVHGWNFVNENMDLTDYKGHGTIVAGIIAAKFNNGIGIAGINPGAVIMPVKVTDDKGQTSSLAIYRGINFAVAHGAKVINLSLGGVGISKLEQQAIAWANAKGVLVVIAAGNTSNNLMTFGPSSSKYALSVGMVDIGGTKKSLVSSWGANLGLVAPGEKIISLCSKDAKDVLRSIRQYGYLKESGTSFSAPMVTATASLIWAKNPQLTNQQVADIIRSTATPMGDGNWNEMTGFGLLNAAAALRADPDKTVIAMITNFHINYDTRDKVSSVDVYGTVRGHFKQFTLEAGRSSGANSFRQVAGPFTDPYDYQFIARLDVRKVLYGNKNWAFRLKVIDDDGKEHDATASLTIPDK